MNLASSLAESYMYMDMFNRDSGKYDGGADVPDRVLSGGTPVEYIVPSVASNKCNAESGQEINGGGGNSEGPFANKVIPVGLVMIQNRIDPDVEYEDHFYPGINREVIPESLYDTLIGAVIVSKGHTKPRRSVTKKVSKRSKSTK